MVFSYGFLDATRDMALWLVLDLQGLPDDPLGFAKQAVFKSAPTLGIYDLGHTVEWTSHFIWVHLCEKGETRQQHQNRLNTQETLMAY